MSEPVIATHLPSNGKKWTIAILIALALLGTSFFYIKIGYGELDYLSLWSFNFAAVASLMYALSLSAGSFSYYLGWPDRKSGYQKQIGLMAYWFSLFYVITLLALYPETYYYGFFNNLLTPDLIFGISALTIFSAMALINSKFISTYFLWDTIKFVLGLGYIAYALLVVRAIFLEYHLWAIWFNTLEGFPPGRLILSIIALAVLLLRISIPIHKNITDKHI